MHVFTDNWREVLVAFGVTIELSLFAGIIALVLGFVLAALRVSPIPLGRAVGAAYVRVVRNTPLLLILLIFAFGLPELGFRPSFNVNAWLGLETRQDLLYFNVFFTYATFGLGLYTASFVCEAVRSGINSIDVGQAEAARSVGMTFAQTIREVILPQAYRAVIPPLASIMIAMTKNSTLAAGVGVTEAAFLMRKFTNDNGDLVTIVFIGFALGYVVIVAIISAFASMLERRARIA